MALARFFRHRGLVAEVIRTSVTVHLHPGKFAIADIELATEAAVAGVSPPEFTRIAMLAKENCPVAKSFGTERVMLKLAALSAGVLGCRLPTARR